MSSIAVRMQAVRKRYRDFALEDIDLSLPQGQIMGLIGANGAGKSTTIRILMGLVHQDSGVVQVLGHAMPAQQVLAKRDIGYVSEDLRLYAAATLAWHMQFIRSIYPSWDQAYAETLLRRFDVRAEQRIKGMSHGQRVKAALLLVLARRPQLLVLDEPTTGLDPVARHEVLGALMEVLSDDARTILFSSHNTLDVEQISDQITFIDRGRIVDSGDKESFLERWRRLRIEMPAGIAAPPLDNIIERSSSGRLSTITTDRFGPGTLVACENAGARVLAVEPMTLEEIFVSNISARREDCT